MTENTELTKLVARRGVLKGHLTRFRNFLDSLEAVGGEEIIDLKNRLHRVDKLWDSFDTIQTDIEVLDNSDGQLRERESFEEIYFELTKEANKILNNYNKEQEAAAGVSPRTPSPSPFSPGNEAQNSQIISHVKLPTLQLPEFSGGYENWLQFSETFDSLINKNNMLTDIQRFFYLMSAVKGEASQMLNSLEMSERNYSTAWQLLQNRYENKRVTITHHVKGILELNSLNKESFSSLRGLLDKFQTHVRSLKNLGEPVDTWDTILVVLMSGKLDPTTKRHWEEKNNLKNMQTLTEFIKFLEERCQLLETLNFDNSKNTHVPTQANQRYTQRFNTYPRTQGQGLTHLSTQKQGYTCIFCKQKHNAYSCEYFLSLQVKDRLAEARSHRVCTNCLRPNHVSRECNSSLCKQCGRKHHTLLHDESFTRSNSTYSNQGNQGIKGTLQGSRQNSTHSTLNSNSNYAQVSNRHETQNTHTGLGTRNVNEQNSDTQGLSASARSQSANSHNQEPIYTQGHNQQNNNSQGYNQNGYTSHTNSGNNTHSSSRINLSSMQKGLHETILATAVVHILDIDGNPIKCRVLLDSGSQSNFLMTSLFNKLKLVRKPVNVPISGINQAQISIKYKTMATLRSLHSSFKAKLSFLIIDKITNNIPVNSYNPKSVLIPKGLNLADPGFYESQPIDALLGAGIFWELLDAGQIKVNKHAPIIQETKLGWVMSGNLMQTCFLSQMQGNFVANKSPDIGNDLLQAQIEKFWLVEEVSQIKTYTKEQQECEEHFVNTYSRDNTGRFTVSLPLKDGYENKLGDSEKNAIKRFYSLERKLLNDLKLKSLYDNFIREYLELDHMEEIKNKIESANDTVNYYLPHHGVYREGSKTTKLRVVFDASAKSSTGYALNDCLKVGPVLQADLFSIVLRFRMHSVVVIGDIQMMYRQINIRESEQNLQRMVYRFNPEDELKYYKLKTVTYGTSSASFLAVRTLHEVAYQNIKNFPKACQVILSDFYMDDLISGFSSVHEAIEVTNQILEILKSARFTLRKFMSNKNTVILNIGSSNQNAVDYLISDDKNTKALGLAWNAETDNLRYSVKLEENSNPITKRVILSTVSKVFDPLGLIGPVTIKGKVLIQKLWQLRLGWDDPVPKEIERFWLEFREQLIYINEIHVPRNLLLPNYINIQMHGFCDASEKAYGASIYIRTQNDQGEIATNILCAKARVSPLKNLSLPRLELCGAVLLAQLSKQVLQDLNSPINDVFYWCDSSIVLAWINSEPPVWKTFVANRVATIQNCTQVSQWNHVKSSDNAADIISRGINPSQLAQSRLWWVGPDWLAKDMSEWPESQVKMDGQLPEKRNIVKLSLIVENNSSDFSIFKKYSSFSRLCRIIAYCRRFINNINSKIKGTDDGQIGYLTTVELNKSIVSLVKLVQEQEFRSEFKKLKEKSYVSKKSKLRCLNPFVDKEGLIRVGGRIANLKINYDTKFPIVLPGKHLLTELIIRNEHLRHLHSGVQGTLNAVRQKFWPINGKNAVKKELKKCIRCFRVKPQGIVQHMGALPEARITPARIFSSVGIDFAGAFQIKDGKCRNRKIIKCYICIFICFVSKAIHIEIAGDLSTESFLNAFKRFVSRRGIPSNVYTDNGGNFQGARNLLEKIFYSMSQNKSNDILEYIAANQVRWHFIPARSPHFGGLWEAAVKSAKYHMKRIIGNLTLDFEAFYTILTQIEAVLNSRPLTPLSCDPDDLAALTPGHFLIGSALTALPEEDVCNIPDNRLTNYKLLQKLVQHFWRRWSREYLNSVQQRTKWQDKSTKIAIGTLVLLKEKDLPPLMWKIARVQKVFPGTDGDVRVVEVKTASSSFKRAVNQVVILPIE